ncbi:MAG: response regulator [Candidatus Gastranaerophilales bacterium]|nr:response regulator [Candidatus Gastranaerophilales bacterium]
MKYNLLIVDDEPDNLQLLQRTFRKKYEVFTTTSVQEALDILKKNKIHLILSDNLMPEMEGVEFLKRSIEFAPNAIRILITAYTDPKAIIEAINTSKIYRYVKKPWLPEDLKTIVDSALATYQLNLDNTKIASDLKDLFQGTINAITAALDAKDSYTLGRSKRVCRYSVEIGKQMNLTDVELTRIELAGLLHDIGMIGVPEAILNKPGNLTQEEFETVKDHVKMGARILGNIKQLESVIEVILHHHEHFNGNGYPNNIKGDDIPLAARIIAIADAYDGMVSDRAYRIGMEHEKAIEIIKSLSNKQFDPQVVEAFLAVIDNIKEKFCIIERK